MTKQKDQKAYLTLYKNVFETPEGQLVLHDICKRWYVYRPTVSKENKGMEDILIREGMRNAALDLLSKVNYDLTKLPENMAKNSLEVHYD